MTAHNAKELLSRRVSRRTVLTGTAVGAAAALGASAFAAPTMLRSARAASEVTYWTSFTGSVEVNALKKIIANFNTSQSNYQAKLVQVPSTSDSDVTKLMTAVRGGVGPDVYHFNRPFALQRAADGVLEDLTSYFNADELKSTYLDFALKECYFKDKLYALPFDTDARALYYRKDILKEVGVDAAELDPAKGGVTVDRVREIAAKIDKKDSSGRYTRMGFVPWFAQGWGYTWGFDFGGTFYDQSQCKVTATNPGVVAGFSFLYDTAKALGAKETQEFMSSVNRPDAPPAQNPFYQGSIAFMVSGDWEVASMKSYAPNVDYGITYIPLAKAGAKPSSWSAGFSTVMPTGAKNKEGAVALIKYMSGPEGQRTYVQETQHFPTIKALLSDASLYDPRHQVFNDILKISTSLPVVPVGALLWDELSAAQDKVTLNQQTAADALKNVENRVQPQLQKYC